MKLANKDGQTMVDVSAVERNGNDLKIRAKIAGTMSMAIYLKPEEAWTIFRLLKWPIIWYMPAFLYKGWKRRHKQ